MCYLFLDIDLLIAIFQNIYQSGRPLLTFIISLMKDLMNRMILIEFRYAFCTSIQYFYFRIHLKNFTLGI